MEIQGLSVIYWTLLSFIQKYFHFLRNFDVFERLTLSVIKILTSMLQCN